MKIVINTCFGGFCLPEACINDLGLDTDYNYTFDYNPRNDPKLVKWVEDHPDFFKDDDCTHLAVVDIPDESTDWKISEYDGAESVLYVVDGKIYKVRRKDERNIGLNRT